MDFSPTILRFRKYAANPPAAPDSLAEIRRRALELFTKQLSPSVEEMLRLKAIFVRSRNRVCGASRSGRSARQNGCRSVKDFDNELNAAIAADSAPAKPPMNAMWMPKPAYFRDYVMPR